LGRCIQDIMTTDVVTIAPDAFLANAYALLREKRISIIIVKQEQRAVGLLTERDVIGIMHENINPSQTTVASVMTSPVTTVAQNMKLFDAYSVLTEHHFRHLVVADDDGLLAGVVTLTDMLDGMGMEHFVDLKQVTAIMSTNLIRVRQHDSLRLVIDLMHRHRISCVIVADEWKPVGIITERDIVKYSDPDIQPDDIKVSSVMSSPVRTLNDHAYIPEVNKVMHEERLRHMVVVDHHGRLSGLISQSDLTGCMDVGYVAYLKNVIEQREKKIKTMRHHAEVQETTAQRLQQYERHFRALAELSHAMSWRLDLTTGSFHDVSQAFKKHLGYPLDTWVDMPTWAARIHADDRQQATMRCTEAIEQGEDVRFSCRMIAEDGQKLSVQVHIAILRQSGKSIELRGFMLPKESE